MNKLNLLHISSLLQSFTESPYTDMLSGDKVPKFYQPLPEPKPTGWNRPCGCGSGLKFKMCCGKTKKEN